MDNALSWNALSWNALSWNALSWNALSWNRLGPNLLAFNAAEHPDIEQYPEGRELLEFMARCAFHPDDSLLVEVGDDDYVYPGLLNLAPSWETQPLTPSQTRMISACLVAHINAFDQSIEVSLRSFGALTASSSEVTDFPVYEATFFGHLFGTELKAYGCQGDEPAIAGWQAPDRAFRVCADPGDDCEVTSLGRCRDVCDTRDPKYGWRNCWADGHRYGETISVYLAADDPTDTQACGPGQKCNLACTGCDCTGHLDCADTRKCKAQCRAGAVCSIDCDDSDRCRAKVSDGSVAEVDCHGASQCKARCAGGSTCEIDCFEAGDCSRIKCVGDSQCLVNCTDAATCGFARCDGPQVSCPGDIVVCNRACP